MTYRRWVPICDEQWRVIAGSLAGGDSTQPYRRATDQLQRVCLLSGRVERELTGPTQSSSHFLSFFWCKFTPKEVNCTDFWVALHPLGSNHKGSQSPVPNGGPRVKVIEDPETSGALQSWCVELASHGAQEAKQAVRGLGVKVMWKTMSVSYTSIWKIEVFGIVSSSTPTSSHGGQMGKIYRLTILSQWERAINCVAGSWPNLC